MILIGLGANLESLEYGPPRATCGAALEALGDAGMALRARASWYRTAPVPASDQPWFVNGVAVVATTLGPDRVLELLLDVERRFGRVRGARNAARIIDLDLLAYDDRIVDGVGPVAARVPHPRLHERAFVLLPLADVAPDWRHPATGAHVAELIGALPEHQETARMADADGLFGTEWHGHGAP